jgi:Ca-activated chloride channel family protein
MKRKLVVSFALVAGGLAILAALAALVLPSLLRARIPTAAIDELPPPPAPPPPVVVEPVAPAPDPVSVPGPISAPAPVSAPVPEVRRPAPAGLRPNLPRAADVDTSVREAEELSRGLASTAVADQKAGRLFAQAEPPPPASPAVAGRARMMIMKKDERDDYGPPAGFNREAYDHIRDNPFLAVASNPLSTFSIDVDTASYANVRRFLTGGQLPPKDAVRIEELVNYFRYDYPEPEGDAPFSISTEVGRCPWKPEHRLALVGLRGRSLDEENLPPRNLTFLLDVSGSMNSGDKLPLLKRAMGVLVDTLREEDRVAIVVYAGASGLVLPPTSGAGKGEIRAALNSLRAGGSTAGGAGIELAYSVATDTFVEGGINRVILATDGDFNVGISSEGDLVRLIEEKRETGVFLSVLGFGRGNLQDSKMEKLADHGNGNYSYIDSFREARKVLGTEAGGTLVTIAKDVKIQVEFNPARVGAYRLIGYENRALRAEDFADDRKDAGEIGAGHTVTALYEIVPVGVDIELPLVDPLKYQQPAAATPGSGTPELLTVKLRHKEPTGTRSRLQSVAVADVEPGREMSANLRFSSAVAAFGMLLRDSEYKGSASWPQVIDLARGAVGPDLEGHRTEFLVLARNAETLSTMEQIAIAR